MFNKKNKHIELLKKQFKKLENNLSVGNETKNTTNDEIEKLIDLLSSYGNKGTLTILELLNDINESSIRIYGYKKIEAVNKL
jgi:hypothetical protein